MKSLLLVLLVVPLLCNGALEILNQDGTWTVLGPMYWLKNKLGPEEFNMTGNVAIADPYSHCEPLVGGREKYEGKIVLFGPDYCYPGKKVREGVKMGAAAVLVTSYSSPGWLGYYWDRKDYSDINIPCGEARWDGAGALNGIYHENPNITIRITPDFNPFDEVNTYAALVSYSVILGIFATITLSLGSRKLYLFIKRDGFHFAIAPAVLVLEILACIFRIAYYIDPQSSYGVYTYKNWEALVSISFVFTLSSSILMGFWWTSVCSQAKLRLTFSFDHWGWKVLCGCVIALLFILEILNISFREAFLPHRAFISAGGWIYVLTAFFTSIYFLVTGIRLIRLLMSGGEGANSETKKVVRFIFVSFAGELLFVISVVFVANSTLFFNPHYYTFLQWGAHLSLQIVSLNHVLVFKDPTGPGHSNISKSSKAPEEDQVHVVEEEEEHEESERPSV